MTKILVIAGTRPEAIKLAPVIKAFRDRARFNVTVCSTGQHREILDQMFAFFGIAPDINLELMTPGQNPSKVAALVIEKLGAIINDLHPDWVVVQGDTTSAMAASIAAFYAHARIAHVEAGLRTSDPYRPFPEEMNRRIIGRTASCHFAPTARAAQALISEGASAGSVHVTGNTVIDALLETCSRIHSGEIAPPVDPFWLESENRILVTSHRRENFDAGIVEICSALRSFAEKRPDWRILFPVHPNPAIREPVHAELGELRSVKLVDPLPYGEFIAALDAATFIVSDSGGVQEEGAALGKPIVVLREETERPEAIENGNAVLVGSNPARISEEMAALSESPQYLAKRSMPCLLFGDGAASSRIADILENTP